MNAHQCGVAAESHTATLFAMSGYDISVQYGANQPEYDLVVVNGDQMVKVSVKGSRDGGWGLTQSFKKDRTYEGAIDFWLNKHSKKTIFSFVQFQNVNIDNGDQPRVYIATPEEIANHMKASRNNYGVTSLKERYEYKSGVGKGHIDQIPELWRFSSQRLSSLIDGVS